MSKKRIGAVVLVIGVVLFVFSMIAKSKIMNAKSEVNQDTSYFSGNPVGNAVGGVLKGQASKYDTMVMLCELGGIALFVIGGAMIFFYRKR
jgi:hypothetical protein